MGARETREWSLCEAKRLGFATNQRLPLLDTNMQMRSLEAIVDRSLTLNVVVSTSFGFSTASAQAWLALEDLHWSTSAIERAVLDGRSDQLHELQDQVEALNAFAWALGFVAEMPFDRESPDNLVKVFPDLKTSAPSSAYRETARLRPVSEVYAALDLAYCLHWAVVDARLNGRTCPRSDDAYIVVERRRALEWMMSDVEWDDVALDT